jgi:hypothetical protein
MQHGDHFAPVPADPIINVVGELFDPGTPDAPVQDRVEFRQPADADQGLARF